MGAMHKAGKTRAAGLIYFMNFHLVDPVGAELATEQLRKSNSNLNSCVKY